LSTRGGARTVGTAPQLTLESAAVPVIKPLGEHELLLFLVQFVLLLVVARGLGELAVRVGLPSVVGELLAGFLLGPSLFGNLAPGLWLDVFPQVPSQVHLLEVVSWLGVIMLLILTGLETDIGLIARKGKGAAAISLGGIAVPFATGVALGFLLPTDFVAAPDKRLVFALFIGTAMSISAIPVIAKVLMEMNIIRRDIGQITLAAGMIDDTVGWILLSIVAGLASSGTISPLTAGKSVLSVLLVLVISFTVGRRAVRALIAGLDNRVGGDMVKITALMALALSFGAVTQALKLEAVLGAFIAGILVGQVKRFDERLRHIFEQVTLGVFAPVFFAASGLRVDLGKLAEPKVLAVGLVVLTIAIAGKFVGAYLGAKATRMGHWEALSLGAGMNARGAMEIIVATIGLSRGILTPEMYSIILMVAIVTSLMAPPILRWTLNHVEPTEEEKARLEAEERRKGSFVGNLKRVLLPVRGEGQADLAAKVVGLIVSDEDVEVTNLYLQRDGKKADVDSAKAGVEEHLEQPRSRVLVEEEGPAAVILAEARKGYDLLVLAATERRTRGEATLFDPFVDDVIQEAPCPLLVVSSNGNGDSRAHLDRLPGGRILVPMAGNDVDRYAAEVAFSMASGTDTEVDVVHVVSGPQHTLRLGGDEAVLNAVEIGEDVVARFAELGRAVGATVNTDVLVADQPENAIVERAQRRADLIVLASSRKPVTQRAFFGHRIDHVVANAPCPVVVVGAR
jgi:Kef-type K+ transport system membrane component KefB/nucleotide-binding universal stress UspA family protein